MFGVHLKISELFQPFLRASIICNLLILCPLILASSPADQEEKAKESTRQFPNHGIVIDDEGKPLQGVDVYLQIPPPRFYFGNIDSDSAFRILGKTQTDVEGKFTFENKEVPADLADYSGIDLFAVSPGKGVAWKQTFCSRDKPQTLRLFPESHVSGLVRNPGGGPVEGATVSVLAIDVPGSEYRSMVEYPTPFSFADSKLTLAAKTDAEGRFDIEGLPANKRISLRVTFDGHLNKHLEFRTDSPEKSAVDALIIKLERERIVRGRVIFDDTNEPAKHFKLYGYPGRYCTTDEHGEFKFEQVANNRMVINTHATPLPYLRTFVVAEFNHNEYETDVTLRVRPGDVLRGRLIDDSGKAIANAGIVHFADVPNPLAQKDDFLKTGTDSNGNFQIAVEPGEGTIYAVGSLASTGLPQMQQIWRIRNGVYDNPDVPNCRVNVVAGQPTDAILLSASLYLRADGVAKFSDGTLATAARIQHLPGEVIPGQYPNQTPEHNSSTDFHGRFRIVGIPGPANQKTDASVHQGVFLFTADGSNAASFLHPNVENRYPTTIVLLPAASIRGSASIDGQPAVGVEVSISTTIDGRRVVLPNQKTSKDGSFAFATLPGGYHYNISYFRNQSSEPAEEDRVVVKVETLDKPVVLKPFIIDSY